jgi:transcription elongation GreA/GreB family factor
MSRAFVRESDQEGDALQERLVSAHPNLVTPAGLKQIAAQLAELEVARQAARDANDKPLLERVKRDLRYWAQRATSARVIEPPAAADLVRFGTRVKVRFADGTQLAFQLVGEDEANPAAGLLSWVAPLAAAVLGQAVGDTVDFQGKRVEVMSIASGE